MRLRGACLGLALAALGGCGREEAPALRVAGGDAGRGRTALEHFECGACHRIPGVRGAHGRLGPPLDHFRRRVYLAGKFPNTPAHLVRWLQNPPALAPRTAMPAVGVSAREARDMAAYLYGLR